MRRNITGGRGAEDEDEDENDDDNNYRRGEGGRERRGRVESLLRYPGTHPGCLIGLKCLSAYPMPILAL